ncbi:MAG TPA: D-alanine--D-alanine ligase [Solirubrobacterales bacterium]|nr:D-alanine--D-alanine ligase [Solirubrobacterales bacterium]
MKVAVLKGGRSLERGVSLRSGARVEDALERLGHGVLPIDVGADLVRRLEAERPDVAFVAMHGAGGEDGTAQELLEILGIPFTGPGAAACSRCIDKVIAKHAIREAGVPTPDWFGFKQTAFRELGAGDALGALEASLGFPLVVKPSRGGSSLGVRFAAAPAEIPQALVSAFSYDEQVLLERFVDGREMAVSVVGDEALPVVEAIPAEGDRYDFEARYEIGRTRFECPADLSEAERAAVVEAALGTYRALGLTGFARVDLILAADGPWVLEANAIPGLTDTSLLPQAAEAAGMSFEDLVSRILDLALAPSAVS